MSSPPNQLPLNATPRHPAAALAQANTLPHYKQIYSLAGLDPTILL